MERPYDIVLYGATGFSGGLTADRLAANAPADTRWALAGRDRTRLEAVRGRLAGINPACADLDLLIADSADPDSMRSVAESARVVAAAAGPYAAVGEPMVAACARAGTDYIDLTGESVFVDQMYARYHEEALRTGARLVHACGFDSVPHDLGAYFTVQHLPEDVPITIEGFVRMSMTPSGGTWHSLIGMVADQGAAARAAKERAAKERHLSRAEGGGTGRRARIDQRPVPRTRLTKGWALPMPTLDPQIIRRSAAALDRYGPDFRYGQYMVTRRLVGAAGTAAGAGGLVVAAKIPRIRDYLLGKRQQGEGPSEDERATGSFLLRFLGEGGGRRVVTEVAGGDPYDATAVIFSQAALCMAHDDLPATAGQVTPAIAMGDALTARLRNQGIAFRLLKEEESA
ncbi:saccharopine dehydrogenase NADP-binding domain-containing protein [Nocardiopsis rhodophaea]|uniref:Saccharopine dehydrogenase NADP-binding domain-containing protein n=1 Tax=Nocardiopsis rhodophaea TaxID=280238 RepID=A0ABN2T2M5_9ACTN